MTISDITTSDLANNGIAGSAATRSHRAETVRVLCGATVLLPGDPGFDEARTPWNVAVDQRPAAVAYPDERRARPRQWCAPRSTAGLRVAPQSTGHNAGPLGRLDDVVIVRTSGMDSVQIDPVRQRARVGGGAIWLPVVEAAAAAGFRRAARLVARRRSGRLFAGRRDLHVRPEARPADQQHHRGARSSRPTAPSCGRTQPRMPSSSGRSAVAAATSASSRPWSSPSSRSTTPTPGCWSGIAGTPNGCCAAGWPGPADAPDEVTTSFRVLNLPPLPDIPEPFRGRQLVVIDGAVLASDEREHRDPRGTAGSRPGAGHLRPGAGRVAGPAAHGSGGSDARRVRTRSCWPECRRRRSGRSSTSPVPLRVDVVGERDPATGRSAEPSAPRCRCDADARRRVPGARRGYRGNTGDGRGGAAGCRPTRRGDGPVPRGSAVPELRRARRPIRARGTTRSPGAGWSPSRRPTTPMRSSWRTTRCAGRSRSRTERSQAVRGNGPGITPRCRDHCAS